MDTDDAPTNVEQTAGTRGPELELAPGTQVGRYVVRCALGRGGMGVVYSAHDPELDREVALKLIRKGSTDARDDDERGRSMLREARALARVTHPNVVPIYDVGSFAGQVFIAMERVEGRTLSEWLRSGPHPRGEVLSAMCAAGRGLAAAHDAGVVHHDFKPSNVLLGHDGRVRVMDFGLASIGGVLVPSTSPSGARYSGDSSGSILIAGTPAYIPPERWLGGQADARGDQFSFCVALWEALTRTRPFTSEEIGRWAENPQQAPVPRAGDMPLQGRLRQVIVRGMAREPDHRWPDMSTLVSAIERGSRRRRPFVAAAGVVAVAGIAAILASESATVSCRGAEAIDRVWHTERAAALTAAFGRSHLHYAAATGERVSVALDDWAHTWRAARINACESESPAAGATIDCFARALSAFDAAVEVLAVAAPETVERADDVLTGLPRAGGCIDGELVGHAAEPAGAAEIRAQLDRARVLHEAGRMAEARVAVEATLVAARALDYEPLTAEVLVQCASTIDQMGDHDLAKTHLEQVVQLSRSMGEDRIALEAMINLIHVVGHGLGRHTEALEWARHAEALIERVPDSEEASAGLHANKGATLIGRGQLDEGLALLERALAIRRAYSPEDSELVAAALGNVGAARLQSGDYAGAREMLEQSLEMRRNLHGVDHPRTTEVLANVGHSEFFGGDVKAAKELYGKVLDIRTRAYGPDNQRTLEAEVHLANAEQQLGDGASAVARYERALAGMERALDHDHPEIGRLHNNLGNALRELGRPDEALRHFEAAVASMESRLGVEHPDLASPLTNIATTLAAAGRFDDARAHAQRALLLRENLGPDHPSLAITLLVLCLLERDAGDVVKARAACERGLAIREKAIGKDHPDTAHVREELATLGAAGERR